MPASAYTPLPEGWKWVRLGDTCRPVAKINPKLEPSRTFTYVDISSIDREMKRVVGPKSVNGLEAPAAARQLIRSGDVLVSTVRPNLNAVALAGPDLDDQVCTTGICVLRPNSSAVSEFLFLIAQTRRFISTLTELTSGTTYPKVADKDVMNVHIPLAPISVQRSLAEKIRLLEVAKRSIEVQLHTSLALPNVLINAALGDRW